MGILKLLHADSHLQRCRNLSSQTSTVHIASSLFPLPGKLFSLESLRIEIVSMRSHYGAPVLDCGIDYDDDNAAAMLLLSKDSDARLRSLEIRSGY